MKITTKIFLVLFAVVFTACNDKYKDLKDGLYADIETEKGNILLELHAKDVPGTVANFVALAEGNHPRVTDSLKGKKYYDGLGFHRVIKNFMIQGGDILGNGTGTPGFTFYDEFPTDSLGDLKYKHDGAGILSMANSGPASNGSQFFITHKETPWLDGKHTVFGKVVTGQEVVDSIAQYDMIKTVKIIRKGKDAEAFDAPKAFEQGETDALAKEKERLAKIEEAKKVFYEKMEVSKATKKSSGLQVLMLDKGKNRGKKVVEKSDVEAHYTLYLSSGKLIQTTVGKNPFNFNLSKRAMIAGFKEGVLGLKEGNKVRLFIPYYLGYGEKEYGPFPPKSDLVFEVEILKVK